jgi:hypothetical protein
LIYALKNDHIGVAVSFWEAYRDVFDTTDLDIQKAVIASWEKSPNYFELKLYILDAFLPAVSESWSPLEMFADNSPSFEYERVD